MQGQVTGGRQHGRGSTRRSGGRLRHHGHGPQGSPVAFGAAQDALKGKGDSKAQLKEILGILNAGPKRPSPLDKPGVMAAAGKKPASSGSGGGLAASAMASMNQATLDPDALLGLIEAEEAATSRCEGSSAFRMGLAYQAGSLAAVSF